MKLRSLPVLTALAVSSVVTLPAQAAALVIDDFNSPTGQVATADVLGGGYSTLATHALSGQIATKRVIEQNLLANALNLGTPAIVTVGGGPTGFLNASHDTGADSDVRITWDIAAFSLSAGSSALALDVLFVNPGPAPATLDFEFRDSSNLLQWTLTKQIGAVAASQETLSLLSQQAAAFAAGGTLQLVMSGEPGWDVVLDTMSIVTTPAPSSVPEPASLGLVVAALAGAGLARRRQKV